jgi:hypothetical protein
MKPNLQLQFSFYRFLSGYNFSPTVLQNNSMMKKKKVLKIIAILGVAGLLIGGGIGLYMFNKPHRDVQSANADYTLTASEIVSEYLTDKDAANKKYLAADGDSKILEITGVVSKISEDHHKRSYPFRCIIRRRP